MIELFVSVVERRRVMISRSEFVKAADKAKTAIQTSGFEPGLIM